MSHILFGLGNPGRRYAKTRHNAGWQVLDTVAARFGASFRKTRLLNGETADLTLGSHRVRLVKPLSYMNLVGSVYRRALDVFECEAERALVIVDDFQLPFGRLRMRPEGSSGGHNGLRSIQQALGTAVYPRLRIGIGPGPPGVQWADFVLKRYGGAERRQLPELLDRAADACDVWVREGPAAAMNRFNPSAD